MRILIALFMACFWLGAPLAQAAETTISPRQLLVQPRSAEAVPSFWESPSAHILARQQQFYTQLSGSIRGMQASHSWAAALGLMGLSFAYGVFHAAGPGHGKAVISGWLLANRAQLRRGIFISALSALFQAFSAILIVGGVLAFAALAGSAARDALRETGFWVEAASYLMITALGMSLAWRALRPARHAHGHHHDHHHDHDHHHSESCGCGHAHMPEPRQLGSAPASLWQSVSLAFAIGIRPCTGALLVLLFASAAGLYAAGIAAIFAMALGTFLTVAAIAGVTVLSRDFALRFAGGESPWLTRAGLTLRAGIGLLIMALGASLLAALISGGHRFV